MSRLLLFSLLVLLLTYRVGQAEESSRADDDPRVTPTVRLVRKCLPAVVSLRVQRPSRQQNTVQFGHGGGSVIHADGYILTNHHVVAGAARVEAAFFRGEWKPVRIVASLPDEDLALLKTDAAGPLPALPLGRSDDLELGEPVISIGSPGGLPHSLSMGVVSGLGRSTNTEHAHLPSMVQTSAPISGGSSGGPLINVLGEQVGVVTSRKADGENLGFAINIDRVRQVFPRLISAEERYGIAVGLEVDTLGGQARAAAVAPDSPAEKAGIRVGDVLVSVGGQPLRQGVDFYLSLIDRKPDDELPLRLSRGESEIDAVVRFQAAEVLQPVAVENPRPGLHWARYEGRWVRLPDFTKLQPKATAVKTAPPWISQDEQDDHFGVVLAGFVKIPRDGLYTFTTSSDDGSRLWVGERLVVDNDGLHPQREASGLVRLPAGFHPLRVEYFEATGEQSLVLCISGPDGKKRTLPADWLFHQP